MVVDIKDNTAQIEDNILDILVGKWGKMGFDIKKIMLRLQNSDTNMYFCNPIKKPFEVFVGAHSSAG